ncbi:MAG: extracellular solute-binding protein [Propionibacteriaceae bacterium]|nr:extracellular solute-binding protein [Propionibacteriaceae bacterium]
MSMPLTSRRSFLGLAAMATAGGLGLAACGSSGPAQPGGSSGGGGGGEGGSGSATMWALSGQPNQTITTNSAAAFNKLGKGAIEVTFFQNDAYKTKIRTAVGANQAPTLIYGWGGGILKSYVDAGQVEDLTSWLDENKALKDKFVPATWGAATLDDKIYAVPTNNTQPIVMYYNKAVFDKAGVQPPATWDDVMKLVETFNSQGVAPFSLAGQSKWTSMMWLEYLFDRIGGPEVFNGIYDNKPDAWSDPAVITSCQRVQELVKAQGFIKGFSSVTADGNADQALLYTGKAAMLLHGGWAYGAMKAANPSFVKDTLGYGTFPSVPGGKGDPKSTVGNPANYWSISSKATDEQKTVAKAYLTDGLFSDADVDAYIASGGVPVVAAAQSKIASSADAPFLNFVFTLISEAPNFQQSWDQALSPTQADALLSNIDQLFLTDITPEQFASKMNSTIGK